MRGWVQNVLFPFLVLLALGVAASLTANVHIPHPVPDYALQAAAVYRLEVGAACFGPLYLAAMSFVLALDGRGFAELGTHGLKVEQVVPAAGGKQDEALAEQIEANRMLEEGLLAYDASLRSTAADLQALQQRVSVMERRR